LSLPLLHALLSDKKSAGQTSFDRVKNKTTAYPALRELQKQTLQT